MSNVCIFDTLDKMYTHVQLQNLTEQSGRDGAQSRAEDSEWHHLELDLRQQESEAGSRTMKLSKFTCLVHLKYV